MTILISKPQKRKDHLFALISEEKEGANSGRGAIRCIINQAKWVHVRPVEGDGYVLRLALPQECDVNDRISSIDSFVLQHTIDHRGAWFENVLTSDQIHSFFRCTLDDTHGIALYVSGSKDPAVVRDGKPVDGGIHALGMLPKDAIVRAEIEALGVSFFPRRFGVRWMLRRLWIDTRPQQMDDEEMAQAWLDHRKAIENGWEQEVCAFERDMDDLCSRLHAQINVIKAKKEEIRGLLQGAMGMQEHEGKKWNDGLEDLARRLAKNRKFYLP